MQRPREPELRVEAEARPDVLHEEPIAHQHRRLDHELLALLELRARHLFRVEVLQREDAEGDVARLVAHHVARDLLDERLVRGGEAHEPEGGKREALHHDLHAEIDHVPARVADDLIEERVQVAVHGIAHAELLGEIAAIYLDVARLVRDLVRGVELALGPRHGVDDLCRGE